MSMIKVLSAAVAATVGFAVRAASAQPSGFIDLGERFEAETVTVEINLPASNAIQWIRIVLPPLTADAGFLDVASRIEEFAEPWMMSPMGVLVDGQGRVIQHFSGLDEGDDLQLWASYGLTGVPRAPYCFTAMHGDIGPLHCDTTPFAGQNGALVGGEYWLAFANDVGCRDGWECINLHPQWSPLVRCTLDIRIQPPNIPYCDGDFNWDGNVDQDDVLYLANVLAGGENPTGRWADYNRDGNADQDDLLALVHTIAGGGCP
ncbi:MAG: dockerin type I domain-containing protein [Phycisphaerales bacterium]